MGRSVGRSVGRLVGQSVSQGNLAAAKLIGHVPLSTQLDYCNFFVYVLQPISQNTRGA